GAARRGGRPGDLVGAPDLAQVAQRRWPGRAVRRRGRAVAHAGGGRGPGVPPPTLADRRGGGTDQHRAGHGERDPATRPPREAAVAAHRLRTSPDFPGRPVTPQVSNHRGPDRYLDRLFRVACPRLTPASGVPADTGLSRLDPSRVIRMLRNSWET